MKPQHRFLTAVVLLLVVPPATATSLVPPQPAPLEPLRLDLDGGKFELACLAPNYVNCGFALAVNGYTCKDIRWVGEICMSAWMGAGGGLSSVAVTGGNALVKASSAFDTCEWAGRSGGCGVVRLRLGQSCTTGSVETEAMVGLAGVGGVLAPPARAEAQSCDLLGLLQSRQSIEHSVDDVTATLHARSPALALAFEDALARGGFTSAR